MDIASIFFSFPLLLPSRPPSPHSFPVWEKYVYLLTIAYLLFYFSFKIYYFTEGNHAIFNFVSDTIFQGTSIFLQINQFICLHSRLVLHCMHTIHALYPAVCWWIWRPLLRFSCYEFCYYKHRSTCITVPWCFPLFQENTKTSCVK